MSVSEHTSEEQRFLSALGEDIAWQWRWEKLWRRLMLVYHLASWAIRLFILAITTFQLSTCGTQPHPWLLLALTTLAMLNVALPQLWSTFKIQQRQEIYDSHARLYSAIRVQFLSGQIDLATAVARYTQISQQSTEAVIRGRP